MEMVDQLAARVVEALPVEAGAKAAAEPARRARMAAVFMVSFTLIETEEDGGAVGQDGDYLERVPSETKLRRSER